MSARLSWTDADFDAMSWHDNHVHGLRIVEAEHGTGTLILDLDYILDWIKGPDGVQFKILPAHLSFRRVSNLRFALDYATPTAAIGPFSIHLIERRFEPRERYTACCWSVQLNWPNGEISFESDGFEQHGWGVPKISDRQVLSQHERTAGSE